MQGKHILVGVTGGIAAYKAPLLVRQLCARGAEVIPVMTEAAHHFVTRVTLQAVSSQRVRDDLWDTNVESAMGHIELARWADAIVIAPATADFIAQAANGHAQNLLSTIYLATSAAAIVAPAMNVHMWQHAATRRNVERLRADGAIFVGPDIGEQACGETGPGRMAEPTEIVDRVAAVLDDHNTSRDEQDTAADGPLIGVRVLITAGPTREPIDPVRYISNHSSGKQGFALAKAARRAGADVTLIAGPVQLATPSGVTRIDVTTAMEMHAAVERAVADQQIFVSVAAVSDYRPIKAQVQKIKKTEQNSTEISIPLTENPDILKCVANRTKRPFVVGFAAETQNALAYAREKRLSKGLDAIIVNDVSDPRIGFDSNDNAVTLIHANGETYFPIQGKEIIAEKLVDAIAELFHRNPI